MAVYDYNWRLKDYSFLNTKGSVCSVFSGGGGSSMGYKLSGFNVIAAADIDAKMMEVYRSNFNVKHSFLCSVTDMLKMDLPQELYDLDILDGSPPCSSFSMVGTRENDWGVEKVFREGQIKQVLDTLFFDFIALGKKLRPKVILAENVTGILMGKAKKYVISIEEAFKDAGYNVSRYRLNASVMGVPQKRERVFFIATRNDIAKPLLRQMDMFSYGVPVNIYQDGVDILYRDIEEQDPQQKGVVKISPDSLKYWHLAKPGKEISEVYEKLNNKRQYFGYFKQHPDKVSNTITAHLGGSVGYHYSVPRTFTKSELIKIGTFPSDYNFLSLSPKYVIGMSVPPIMVAHIADAIYSDILNKQL